MKTRWIVISMFLLLMITIAGSALAANPIKLIVNGQEIKPDVLPQLIDGRIMIPIRSVAESLGADVQWDGPANTVRIEGGHPSSPESISKEQVATLIRAQGKHNKDSYYIDGLSYELANLDTDTDLEVVARIDGAVHLGNFFIFDKDSSGEYKLIAEQDWKVEQWNLDDPIDIDGKKIFTLVTRTGGTGIDIFTAHLWYLEQGKFTEAWQGTTLERSAAPVPESYFERVGGYQVDTEGKRLYAWETTHQLEPDDGVTLKGEAKTVTTIYSFDGVSFEDPANEKNSRS